LDGVNGRRPNGHRSPGGFGLADQSVDDLSECVWEWVFPLSPPLSRTSPLKEHPAHFPVSVGPFVSTANPVELELVLLSEDLKPHPSDRIKTAPIVCGK
jgi:hypothetical protein